MTLRNPRGIYGETLVKLGKENRDIVVCDADLSKSTMTCLFQDALPDRFFEMGIAEQNMTSFAAGLALTGKIAFINSFAVFATGRNYDQLRTSVCIGKLNVKVGGSSAGLSDCGDGATHQSVDDIALMRALPHMVVLVPADGIETRKAVEYAAAHQGPVYIRVNRNDLPDVLPENEPFRPGLPNLVRDGEDAVVFACGYMVSKALAAAERMEAEGRSVKVVNVSCLKPVDEEAIRNLAVGTRAVVTVEEHSVIGGLASLISFALRGLGVPMEAVAIQDRFGQSAHDYEELLREYGLDEMSITAAIRETLKKGNAL